MLIGLFCGKNYLYFYKESASWNYMIFFVDPLHSSLQRMRVEVMSARVAIKR